MISVSMSRQSDEVFVKIKNLEKTNKQALSNGFNQLGESLVRRVQNTILNEPKHGRFYKISTNGVKRLHRASAPGQTPAIISGKYFESTYYESSGWQGLRFINDAPYALYLEKGTKKMKPRPGMKNAIKSELRNGKMYLESSLSKAMR